MIDHPAKGACVDDGEGAAACEHHDKHPSRTNSSTDRTCGRGSLKGSEGSPRKQLKDPSCAWLYMRRAIGVPKVLGERGLEGFEGVIVQSL